MRRVYPDHWSLRRKLRRLQTFHGASAAIALFLTFVILERKGGWWGLFSGAALAIGILYQYRGDRAKIMASEAIKKSKG